MKFWLPVGLAVASGLASATVAETTSCIPPAQWANWDAAAVQAGPAIVPGARMELPLKPVASVKLAGTPGKPAAVDSYAGVFPLTVAKSGKLQVALSDTSYVDLIREGKVAISVGHGHGPDCMTIHKIVTFDVTPGRYTVQITSAPSASVRLLAAVG